MDTHTDQPFIIIIETQPPPQVPPPSPSETSLPILAISVVGILATAILLLSYYVFVIKCCLSWHRSDVIRRLSRSRRRWRNTDGHTLSSLYLSTIAADRGLDESAIQAIPTLRFRRGEQQNSFHECSVCLNEFQDEERIRMLPNCLHVFHIDCIDIWLQTHANCPLCRAEITSKSPIPVMQPNCNQGERVAIDVRDEGSHHTSRNEGRNHNDNPTANYSVGKERKLNKVSSMGDECIDMRGKVNEQFGGVQPMRRSFSMDSSSDRQLYMAVQEMLRQNPHFRESGNGEGTSTSSGRTRQSFFSFGGHCRTSRSCVLPNHKNEH